MANRPRASWAQVPMRVLASAASVALVTGAIAILHPYVPVLSLGVLYVFAVLATAVFFGLKYALAVALASMAAFDALFLIPEHIVSMSHPSGWLVLAVYAATAVVVSELAARARRRADVSEQARGLLAEEQAALRRVATLVAHRAPPAEVFAAVAEEVAALLGADVTHIVRCEPDGTVTTMARSGTEIEEVPIGARTRPDEPLVTARVLRTGRSARIDSYDDLPGPSAALIRRLGIRSSVGNPIVVEGGLWGAMVVSSTTAEPLPDDAEARLENFTDLVGTAISNAESRAKLAASRARIVAASDEARRRIERDLHDGIQQRIVSLGLDLRAIQAAVPPEFVEVDKQLSEMADGLAAMLDDVRELSRGIHPAILSQGGLGAALKALARRSPVPVQLDASVDKTRVPERIEVVAYYIVSEALTNAAKHARASVLEVEVEARDDVLHISVRDDGVGGAHPARGSGLIGLTDRVDAIGGNIDIVSPPGEGTSIVVELPLEAM
jgi:signal transduction histidine kinase